MELRIHIMEVVLIYLFQHPVLGQYPFLLRIAEENQQQRLLNQLQFSHIAIQQLQLYRQDERILLEMQHQTAHIYKLYSQPLQQV